VTSLLATEARKQAAEAERQGRDYREFSDFMLNRVLKLVDPMTVGGRPPTGKDFLDAANLSLEGLFGEQPLVEASIRTQLGETYRMYGEFESARSQLTRSLELQRRQSEVDPRLMVRTLTGLGWAYGEDLPMKSAEAIFEEAIATGTRRLGSDHPLTLEAWLGLGSLYVELSRYSEAEAISTNLMASYARLSDFTQSSLYANGILARTLSERGQLDRAETLLRQRLDTALALANMGTNHPGTLNTHWMLAHVLGLQADPLKSEEAEVLLRDALARQSTVFGGQEQQWYLMSQHELGVLLRRRGDLQRAEEQLAPCLATRVRRYGETQLWTIESLVELGWLRAGQGNLNEARSHFQRALTLANVELTTEHPIALNATHGLGVVALKEQQFQNAEPLLLSAFRGKLKVHGTNYPGTVDVRRDLAALYEAWGRADEAERWRADMGATP
jgi:tetratricopeptide (TPR) repeat protein